MKKVFFLVAAVLATGLVYGSDQWSAPSANTSQPISVEYGGLKYSTSSFSVNYVTASVTGPIVWSGVLFSTSASSVLDFVDVWDATSTANTVGAPQWRIYNVNGSTVTGAAATGASLSGWNGPKTPIRNNRGLIWRASNAAINFISVLYYKPD